MAPFRPLPRAAGALLAALLLAQASRAGAAAPAAQATVTVAASPPPPTAPVAPQPPAAPAPLGAGRISMGVLVTGLSTYSLPVQADIATAFASVASSAVAGVTSIPASDVVVNATSYAAYAAVTLQGAQRAGGTGCGGNASVGV
jgi:hypothetical protein